MTNYSTNHSTNHSTNYSSTNHIRLVGIFNIVWGVMGFLGILVSAFFIIFGLTAAGVQSGEDAPFIVAGGFLTLFLIIFIVASLPCLLAGYGLLTNKSWARPLTIVVSILNLAAVPFGTALGVYGLAVLLKEGNRREYSGAPNHV